MAYLNTAEERLYRWLKRKTTPADAWKQMSIKALSAKVRCSMSQVSRSLPKAVARLEGISLDVAEKRVSDAIRVRQGRLVDFEVEMILELRSLKNPPSYTSIANAFAVSERRVITVCLQAGREGLSGYYHSSRNVLSLIDSDRIAELHENIRIRTKRRQEMKGKEKAKADQIRRKDVMKMLSHIRIRTDLSYLLR